MEQPVWGPGCQNPSLRSLCPTKGSTGHPHSPCWAQKPNAGQLSDWESRPAGLGQVITVLLKILDALWPWVSCALTVSLNFLNP